MNSADPFMLLDGIPPPAAEGEDQGVGKEADFEVIKNEYIGPESKPVIEEPKAVMPKKDTADRKPDDSPKIGDPQPGNTEQKKKGLLQKLFGKKEKKGN